MIRFLAKRFIPDYENAHNPAVRQAYGTLCGLVGIALNLLLFCAKLAAGILSGAISMIADAFNNLSDAGSSVITLLGFRLSARKPQSEHPYGFGRYEYIAGLIVSLVILVVGFDLAKSSIAKIFRPEPMEFSWISAAILLFSILVKLYMTAYNRAVGKKIESATIAATAADSLSDSIATAVVLLCALIFHFTGLNLDAWAGAAVSLLILRAGVLAAKDTIDPLLGKAPDPAFVKAIDQIVHSCPDIIGIHDLMVHDYGAGRVLISLHAEVPADGDIMLLHDSIDNIERRLQRELACNATIHMDPVSTNDAEIAAMRAKVADLLRDALGESVSLHDFRMVPGASHTNVIFDAVIPYDFPMSDIEVSREIKRIVESMDGNFFAVVTIDHPMAGRN